MSEAKLAYVPLLRWKQAERLSLRDLFQQDDARTVLPLVEIVPSAVDDGKLLKLPQRLGNSWGGRRMLLDGSPRGLSSRVQAGTVYTHLAGHVPCLRVTPVVVPGDDDAAVASAIGLSQRSESGLALRVSPDQLHLVPGLLQRLGGHLEMLDLIVDFAAVQCVDPRYSAVLGEIPEADLGRTVIFLGGAFPKDLSDLEVGQHTLARYDWLTWTNMSVPPGCRRPLYGDYTIQCADYREPPQFANVSASIRYAAPEDWVIMRGEGVRNATGSGSAQWPANAQLLRERPEFCGAAFSVGDRYIDMMGTAPPSNGSPGSWLRAGINHHMSLASRQAASLL
jgi:hypothetical protein